MKVFTTEPGVQFYSGNKLNVDSAKSGKTYRKHSGFCLETQHFPDAINNPAFPCIVLEKEKKLQSFTVYRFSTQ